MTDPRPISTAVEATTTLPTIPADTLASRCEFYRRTCELDARVRPEMEAITVAASNRLGAVTMPAELAARVRLHLQHQGVRVGPIISHPRASRWTFLVRPDIPDDAATFARLFGIQVDVARPGTEIALPSPVRRHIGFRCWSQPATDAYRPSGLIVLAAIDACTGVPRRRARHAHSR